MRMTLSPRAGRMLGRLPRTTVHSALELALLTLIAIQCARLAWALVTPLGPVGDWRPGGAAPVAAASSALGGFDPFFRVAEASGPAVVTSLDLTLHGVREDRATGRGSAILGLPGGEQQSFAVGEEIMPGVVLREVGFDSVTILRNGAPEQIFLAQPEAAAETGAQAQAAPAAAAPAAPSASGQAVQFQPRMAGNKVTGIVVQPGPNADAFRAAGFAPGDVVVSINGQRVSSAEQARTLSTQGSGEVAVTVERGGRAIPLRVRF